jgi:hypothetical protein
MYDIHNRMREDYHVSAERQKQQYDYSRPRQLRFKRGDFVLRLHMPSKLGKMRMPFKGPYCIVRKENDTHYVIQESEDQTPFQEHIDRLTTYYKQPGEILEPWFSIQSQPVDVMTQTSAQNIHLPAKPLAVESNMDTSEVSQVPHSLFTQPDLLTPPSTPFVMADTKHTFIRFCRFRR